MILAQTFGAAEWLEFIGRLHPLALHLPIGLFAGAVLMELVAWWSPGASGGRRVMHLALAGSAAVAAFTGWQLGSGQDYGGALVDDHRTLGLAFAGTTVAVALAELLGSGSTRGVLLRRVLLVLCGGLLTVTGHHGGMITHGQRFLSEKAPAWLAPWVGPAPRERRASEPPAPAGDGEETITEEVEAPGPAVSSEVQVTEAEEATPAEAGDPIVGLVAAFDRLCIECHCETKAKADLRLDIVDGWIVDADPEDPEMSELVYRVSLPADDPDAMPPKGERLDAASIAALTAWMKAGADPGPIQAALESR